jgi:hypothetical protein
MEEISRILFNEGINLVKISAIMAAILYVGNLDDSNKQEFTKKYGVMSLLEIQEMVNNQGK